MEIGGFGGLKGLPGLGELFLFEVEVGEGYLDFGQAVGGVRLAGVVGLRGNGQGGAVVLLCLGKIAAAAGQMAQVEMGGDLGVGAACGGG